MVNSILLVVQLCRSVNASFVSISTSHKNRLSFDVTLSRHIWIHSFKSIEDHQQEGNRIISESLISKFNINRLFVKSSE